MALGWSDAEVEKQLRDVAKDAKFTSFTAQYLRKNESQIPELSKRRTKNGMSIADLIKTGVAIPNSKCGLYAADAESYNVFKDITTFVVNGHNLQPFDKPAPDFGEPPKFVPLDLKLSADAAARVVSARCRFARNVDGYAYPTAATKQQRQSVHDELVSALLSMTGDLAGSYQKMEDIPEATREVMIKDHQLFHNKDEYLELGGFYRDWPSGRGVFMNNDKTIIIWINEEDHLRFTSLEKGANIHSVYNKANRVMEHMQAWNGGKIKLSHNPSFGFLASCPTNVGTGMRASVHIDLPNLKAKKSIDEIKQQCKDWNLDIRGIYGENTGFDGTVFDVSNRRRFDVTPETAIRDVITGLDKLVALDISLK